MGIFYERGTPVTPSGIPPSGAVDVGERDFIELMASDRTLETSRKCPKLMFLQDLTIWTLSPQSPASMSFLSSSSYAGVGVEHRQRWREKEPSLAKSVGPNGRHK